MKTRRQFIQASLAGTGLLFASRALGPEWPVGRGSGGTRLQLQGMVYEPGLPHSAVFGATARRLGLADFAIEDDITPVWTRLQALWRIAPAAIGGLTTFTPLMLLEQTGRDHGMRVVYRAEHRTESSGGVTHDLRGPPDMLRAFGLSAQRGGGFGACAARAMLRCPVAPGDTATASLHTSNHLAGANDRALYSWVLAPRQPRTQGAHA